MPHSQSHALPHLASLLFCCTLLAFFIPHARGDLARPTTAPAAPDLLHPAPDAGAIVPFEPTASYEVRTIDGWHVLVSQKLTHSDPDLAARTLELLHHHLYQATREVPPKALQKIRSVTIWVELNDPMVQCMCYHPDVGWVRGHGLNPEKTHGVELGNAKNFLDWAHQQPWMVLHELAHAYHHQFLPGGFENPEILAAYQAAKEKKLYDAVLRNNGRTERAYAMTNPMEYFAECSEAFFGTNDFYPFVRVEFKAFDPQGFDTLRNAWGQGAPLRTPATAPATGRGNALAE